MPPKSLLEQMQELLASVNADLAGLGADLQSSAARTAEEHDPANGLADSPPTLPTCPPAESPAQGR
jgi:hypothetical protein